MGRSDEDGWRSEQSAPSFSESKILDGFTVYFHFGT